MASGSDLEENSQSEGEDVEEEKEQQQQHSSARRRGEGKPRPEETNTNNKKPDIVECSTSPPMRVSYAPPPLPKTTYREPCYIPPLPLPREPQNNSVVAGARTQPNRRATGSVGGSNSHHQRMFIPKPQLTVSHHKSMKQKNALLSNELSNLNLAGDYDHRRNCNDEELEEFVGYEYVPRTASKRVLMSNHQPPLTDVVIDVFPKPQNRASNSNYIDQTLGIPVDMAPPLPAIKTNLQRHHGAINPLASLVVQQKTENINYHHRQTASNHPHQLLHQYPLISGQIPAVNGGERFSSVRPFSEGLPVVQPSAIAGGGGFGGAGSSSNSSKSSGEKQKVKVKFSETITVAEIPRKEKQSDRLMGNERRGAIGGSSNGIERLRYTDPRRELADSLPLCHPDEDFLKDFQPASAEGKRIIVWWKEVDY